MKRSFSLLTILLCLVPVAPGLAAEPTARELFDALPKQVQAEAEAKRAGRLPQGVGQSDPNYLLSFYRNAREYLENGDESNAVQQLRQMEQGAATDPMRAACEAVVNKLRQERADKEAAYTAEVAAVLQRAGQAILAAKVPKDLDASLRELAALAEKRPLARRRGDDSTDTRIQNATRFVTRWQDYLLASSRNESRAVGDTLRGMMQDGDASALLGVPRSEIISRIPPVPVERSSEPTRKTASAAEINAALEAAFNRLKTLDDLPAAIHDLTAFRDDALNGSGGYGNTNEFTATLNALQGLYQTSQELQNGMNRLPLAWFNRYDSQGFPHAEARLIPLRAQLIALSLPRTLGAPETEKPAPGEHVDAFLDRLLAAARKRGDWEAVARGLEVRRLLASGSLYESGRSASQEEDTAFKQFFAAQNYEQAGQYVQAVAAYLTALGTGSQEIPVAVIGERLAAIKKDHPAESASAEQAVLPTAALDYNLARRLYRRELSQAPAAEDSTPTPTASPTTSPTPSPSPTPAATATASPKPGP